MSARRRRAPRVLFAVFALSCTTEPHSGPPALLQVVAGGEQTGIVGRELPNPIVVKVTDASGTPVPGQIVNFVVTSGGGSVFAGAAISNATGTAQERWTLGQVAAVAQRLEARAVDNATGERIVYATVAAVARADVPDTLIASAGTGQSAVAGSAVATPPAVRVLDQFGNPVPGVTVEFAVTEGGGSLTGASPVTDTNGVAAVSSWTTGATAGTNTVTATVAGVPAVSISAMGIPGAATQLQKLRGDNQTGTVHSLVSTRPAVAVRDANGNPVPGVVVTFIAFGGSVCGSEGCAPGSLWQASTGTDGTAEVEWRLRDRAGADSMRISIGDGLLIQYFTATAVPGPLSAVQRVAGDSQVVVLGSPVPVPPSARVVDAYDNGIPGVAVTFATGSGTVIGASPTTDAGGIATVGSWTPTAPGLNELTASTGTVTSAFTASAVPASMTMVTASYMRTCATAGANGTYCWGDSLIGDGTFRHRPLPARVGGGMTLEAVQTGRNHTCGVTAIGDAWCWGKNSDPVCCISDTYGRLGIGTQLPNVSPDPLSVTGGHAFSSLSTFDSHTCALAAGTVYCWGNAKSGRAGDGIDLSEHHGLLSPTAIVGGLSYVSVAAGGTHSCAIRDTGDAYCWGTIITGGNRGIPQQIAGGLTFVSVVAGGGHACALTSGGVAYCWGPNTSGQLGDGSTTTTGVPVTVSGGMAFSSLSGGGSHTCGIDPNGQAYCWGSNASGQLGDGTTTSRLTPTPVAAPPGVTFAAISAGGSHTCALSSTGVVYCWGSNSTGQLGRAGTTQELVPRSLTP